MELPAEQARREIEEALFSREELRELPLELHTQFFKSGESSARLKGSWNCIRRTQRPPAACLFGGSLPIAQNVTANVERLKQAASGVQFSAVNPNARVESASLGAPSLAGSEHAFGVRSVLLALRTLAKDLAPIPGRKSLIFLT